MKFCSYLRFHIKMICRRFRIIRPFTFWDIRTRDMWNVLLQTNRNNRTCWKIAYFLRKTQNLRVKNSLIPRIKNTRFSGCCFHVNPSIQWNFQIYVNVPLNLLYRDIQFLIKRCIVFIINIVKQIRCTLNVFNNKLTKIPDFT